MKTKESYLVLNSGPEFFNDLELEFEHASEYIFIKQFLWRNDEAGRRVGNALLRAMDRGVKVYVVKDRIGAFCEYGERNGQSFFHDQPEKDPFLAVHSLRTVYLQSKYLFSKFYGNPVLPQMPNDLREKICGHRNAKIMDQYKLYDHSKLIIVDGRFTYLGGIGFANEFLGVAGAEAWRDYMLKISGDHGSQALLKLLSGQKFAGELRFLNDTFLKKQGSSLHEYFLAAIDATRVSLTIEMPFLGHPDYINAITRAVERGVATTLILPRRASSHHHRNIHFLKRLLRQVQCSSLLEIFMSKNIIHGKILISDQKMLFGSHNFSMDKSVMEEVVIEVTEQDLLMNVKSKIMRHAHLCEGFDGSVTWSSIIVPSRFEYLSIKLQTLMKRLRRKEIGRVMGEYQSFIGEIAKEVQ